MRLPHFEHNGRGYDQFTAAELLEAGVPEAVIDNQIAKLRGNDIKDECRKRIYAIASSEAQINVSTIVGVISAKTASSRTDEEKAILAAAELGIKWVADMRAAIPALAADPGADFNIDAAWPECPPEAVGLYSQF